MVSNRREVFVNINKKLICKYSNYLGVGDEEIACTFKKLKQQTLPEIKQCLLKLKNQELSGKSVLLSIM